jgi:hypothetical protein
LTSGVESSLAKADTKLAVLMHSLFDHGQEVAKNWLLAERLASFRWIGIHETNYFVAAPFIGEKIED